MDGEIKLIEGEEFYDRRTAKVVVAERLRDQILRGEIEPGTKLRQAEIAKRFGLSITPVREAITMLQAEGLVIVNPHRAAVVFRASVREVSEYYEIRENLESLAVAKAIPRMDAPRLEYLQQLIDKMRQADGKEWHDLNDEFHHSLYEPSDNKQLCDMIVNIRNSSSPYFHMFLERHSDRFSDHRADDEHQAILDACKEGDIETAKSQVAAHLLRSAQELVRLFEEFEST